MESKTVVVDEQEFLNNVKELSDLILDAILSKEGKKTYLAAEVYTALRYTLTIYANALGKETAKKIESNVLILNQEDYKS